MQTTLKEIEKYKIEEGYYDTFSWEKLLISLNKTPADNEPLDFIIIHEAIGIKEAIWCLRTQKYRSYCLFLADIAELILPVFEIEYPNIKEPRQTIKAIRDWYDGNITKKQLEAYSEKAYAAASTTKPIYTNATHKITIYTPFTPTTAKTAALTAIYASDAINHTSATATITNAVATTLTWEDINRLFIKHFGKK